jgi:hypothetical protein
LKVSELVFFFLWPGFALSSRAAFRRPGLAVTVALPQVAGSTVLAGGTRREQRPESGPNLKLRARSWRLGQPAGYSQAECQAVTGQFRGGLCFSSQRPSTSASGPRQFPVTLRVLRPRCTDSRAGFTGWREYPASIPRSWAQRRPRPTPKGTEDRTTGTATGPGAGYPVMKPPPGHTASARPGPGPGRAGGAGRYSVTMSVPFGAQPAASSVTAAN